MRRGLRPAFVVTVSLSVVACAAPPATSSPPSAAPPASSPSTAEAAPTSAPVRTSTATSAASTDTSGVGPFRRHPRDASSRVIYKRPNGACFIEVVESAEQRRFRFDDVACPAVMGDPAYQRCDNGEIRATNEGCVCARLGNPPRPPVVTDCPAH